MNKTMHRKAALAALSDGIKLIERGLKDGNREALRVGVFWCAFAANAIKIASGVSK